MWGLRAWSRLTVVLWAVGLLVAWGRVPDAAVLEVPEPEPRARLQAVADAAPAPEPAAEPPPPRAAPEPPAPAPEPPAPAAKVAEIEAADVAVGDALLSGSGRFPALLASYQGMQSFRSYANAMAALGGRFVVVSHRKIVGEIDLGRNALREVDLDRAFSPRARDYSDEPALAAPARLARERFGPQAEIMLLVPRALDAGLFGGIARELSEQGEGHANYREIEGRYERAADGGLRFRLVSGLRMDGRRVPLSAVFDLDALASGARG